MFERFTRQARQVLVEAQTEAIGLGHNYIGTEHILLGLLSAPRVRTLLAVSPDAVREAIGTALSTAITERRTEGEESKLRKIRKAVSAGSPPFTPRAKKALELSLREALTLGHNYIGTEHLLLGLLREAEGIGGAVLTGLGVKHGDVIKRLRDLPDDPQPEPELLPKFTNGYAAFQRSVGAAVAQQDSFGTHDALVVLLGDDNSAAAKILGSLGVTIDVVRLRAAELGVEGTSDDPVISEPVEVKVGTRSLKIDDPETRKKIIDLLREHEDEADAG